VSCWLFKKDYYISVFRQPEESSTNCDNLVIYYLVPDFPVIATLTVLLSFKPRKLLPTFHH